jgi:ferredoxin--NADP+ reductase
MKPQAKYLAAVIGAGPAGLFAARELASHDVHVSMINRDLKPGGLAEYGIYPSKHRMKEGLRAQFRQILALEDIDYYGNLTVGENGDIKLAELRALGYQAILITTGAQGTKWLGLPGESLEGVYHAKDLVYHYNRLPPFSQQKFHIGKRVAIIGAGNVMLDIAHFLATRPQVEEIIAVIRRGPDEIKFSRIELDHVARLIDMQDLQVEMERVAPMMKAIDQDPQKFMNLVEAALMKAADTVSHAKIKFRFLASPKQLLGGENGKVSMLEVEDNTLVLDRLGEARARSLGTRQMLPFDTVIFAIGDRVDSDFGIPVIGSEYSKDPNPKFPMEGNSYEVYDPETNCPLTGVFVAGWSRQASSGLVGVARRDGILGAKAMLQYLQTLTSLDRLPLEKIEQRFNKISKPLVTKEEVALLEKIEHQQAYQLSLEEFKFLSNQEMLEAVGLLAASLPDKDSSLG